MSEHSAQENAGGAPAPARIAYLLSQYPARSHTFLLNEVRGLRARGLDILVASINAPDRALQDLPPDEAAEASSTFYVKRTGRLQAVRAVAMTLLQRPGLAMRGLRAISRLPGLPTSRRAFWLFYLAEAILVGRWMREERLQHLHVHFGGAVAAVGMLTSILWRIPYSLTIHGPEELLDPHGYQLPAKLAQAEFVICISDFCRGELRRIAPPTQSSKFAVVRLGVDPLAPAPHDPDPNPAGIRHHTPTLVCVGRLVPEKGHRVLLDSLCTLRERGITFYAVLIGTGPLEAELREFVARQQMSGQVAFTSGLSHAGTLAQVRSADVFALASYAEGIPVALMEAMSFAIPCVSTTVAGIPELIHSGRSGLLVPPGDGAAFADALQRLLTDGALRRRLGSAGREAVLAGYLLPRNLDTLAIHWREQLASASLRRASLGRRA